MNDFLKKKIEGAKKFQTVLLVIEQMIFNQVLKL